MSDIMSNNSELLKYLETVRGNLARFEDISMRLIIQGMPIIVGLITLSSILGKYSLIVSIGSIVGAISFTAILVYMTRYYTLHMRICSEIAEILEDKIFKDDNIKLTRRITEKKVSQEKSYQTQKWEILQYKWDTATLSGFIVLLIIEILLLCFYSILFVSGHKLE